MREVKGKVHSSPAPPTVPNVAEPPEGPPTMPQLMQVPGQNTWLLAPPQDPSSQGKQHSLPTLQQGHGQFLLPAFMPAPARSPTRPLDFLKVNNKGPEKPSYRDFMWGAIQFALSLPNKQLNDYLKHLTFLASKAKTNSGIACI